ncbi:MAG: restriction endonuclease [Rhizobiaceae bacterium]|nr:MAG: restriction endonuclease [Rhizobiaceae bacterium]
MSSAVFIHRPDSIYADIPAEQHEFPRRYLGAAKACVGEWIVYLEPRRAQNARGYFGVARVQDVIPDHRVPGMYLALIEPRTFLEFPNPVPFSGADGVAERGLLNAQGKVSGLKQSAVRPLSAADFHRIVTAGLDEPDILLPRTGEAAPTGFDDEQTPFIYEQERERVSQLTSRLVRDRVFRRLVLQAYDQRCAITGLKLINGGGRAEVEAAHIRPVEANGPDILTNGIALSGTMHWMFDRGLIGLSDDLDILVSRHVNDPEGVRGMFNRTGNAIVPHRPSQRPHPRFLEWHRDNRFKQ